MLGQICSELPWALGKALSLSLYIYIYRTSSPGQSAPCPDVDPPIISEGTVRREHVLGGECPREASRREKDNSRQAVVSRGHERTQKNVANANVRAQVVQTVCSVCQTTHRRTLTAQYRRRSRPSRRGARLVDSGYCQAA